MLGLKLNHVSKRGPRKQKCFQSVIIVPYMITFQTMYRLIITHRGQVTHLNVSKQDINGSDYCRHYLPSLTAPSPVIKTTNGATIDDHHGNSGFSVTGSRYRLLSLMILLTSVPWFPTTCLIIYGSLPTHFRNANKHSRLMLTVGIA